MASRGVGVWTQLWRGVVAYRVAALVYAVALTLNVRKDFAHPGAALGAIAAMVVWTAVSTVANSRDGGRLWPVVLADHVVCAALTIASIPIQGSGEIATGAPTLTTAWAAAPVLGSALLGGPWGGVGGALVQGAASVVVRGHLPQATLGNVVLLLLAGGVGGYVARLAVAAEARLAEAVRLAAATRERERLARGIHDGVLQVLALVRRRGTELGGPAAELGTLAGEQETALRTLITTPPPILPTHGSAAHGPAGQGGTGRGGVGRGGAGRGGAGRGGAGRGGAGRGGAGQGGAGQGGAGQGGAGHGSGAAAESGERRSGGPRRFRWSAAADGRAGRRGGGLRRSQRAAAAAEVDLRSLVGVWRSEEVTVSGPAEPVLLPEYAAGELAAAVRAALDNVAGHGGGRAWVLIEDLGAAVAVSVRDEGPGIPAGRLEQAERDGRLGVASSMRGRIADLGGTMSVHTVPGEGTEIEFRVPRGAQ